MGCIKLHILDEQYKKTEMRVCYKKEQIPDYTYDEHGNMLTMPHIKNYWDEKDRLFSAGNSTFINYNNYDAQGNRSRKVVEKGNIIETRYYINGYELFRKEVNGSLETERTTINVADDEKVFVRIETETGQNGVARYQYDNHLGSACLELDELGQIISYEEYHPFGTTSYRSGRSEVEVSLKRYKYCGKERDEETGLYYYGMRYYAAWICRFVSVDPLQFEYPELNPFQYASNNPVTMVDLDGLEGVKPEDVNINQIINKTTTTSEYEENGNKYKSVENSFQYGVHATSESFELKYIYSSTSQELYQFSDLTNSWELFSYNQIVETYIEENYSNSLQLPDTYPESPSCQFIDNTLEVIDYLNLIFDSAGNSLDKNAGKTQIGSNNKLYFEKPSGRVFYGNQYVSTQSLAKMGSRISKFTGPAGHFISAAQIGYGVYQDNWTYGYNAQKQTASVVGGIVGAWAGAVVGAKSGALLGGAIGVWIGGVGAIPAAVVGAIVGGFLGGIFGSIGGSKAAEKTYDYFYY